MRLNNFADGGYEAVRAIKTIKRYIDTTLMKTRVPRRLPDSQVRAQSALIICCRLLFGALTMLNFVSRITTVIGPEPSDNGLITADVRSD